MGLEVVSTSGTAVSLADAKAYLRLDTGDEDHLVLDLIAAATEWVQDQTGQQITPASLRLTLDAFPTGREIKLPRPPLHAVNDLHYTDERGLTRTLNSSFYTTDTAARPGRIVLLPGQQWPGTDGRAAAVTVEFEAGPSDDRPLSPSLKQAILFMVGHWFEHREAVTDRTFTDVPLTVQAVLTRHTFHEAL